MSKPSMAQGKHFLEMLLSATEEEVQQLNHNGDLLKTMLKAPNLKAVDRAAFKELLYVNFNPYADEKTEPAYGYPKGYESKDLQVQLEGLQKIYPQLDASQVVGVRASVSAVAASFTPAVLSGMRDGRSITTASGLCPHGLLVITC